MIVLFDYYCRESPAAVINQRNTRTLVKRQSVQSKDLMVGECRPDPACFCLDPGTLQGGATRLRSLTVLPGLRFPASVPLGRRMHLDSTVAGCSLVRRRCPTWENGINYPTELDATLLTFYIKGRVYGLVHGQCLCQIYRKKDGDNWLKDSVKDDASKRTIETLLGVPPNGLCYPHFEVYSKTYRDRRGQEHTNEGGSTHGCFSLGYNLSSCIYVDRVITLRSGYTCR